jgi:diguanylate cyclase (GGDEF)-like protein
MKVISDGYATAPHQPESGALVPHYEAQRMRAVRRYEILDTSADGVFDRITSLAARLFQVPTAWVGIVDSDRVWFKSRCGLDMAQAARTSWPCAMAILRQSPWLVEDAQAEPRISSSPHVTGEPGIRFYAGAPLTTIDGYNIGTLALLDRQPRKLSETELSALQDLASLVMHELELRVAARRTWELEETLLDKILKEKQCAEYVARHDHVTGLGNRRMLDESIAVEINRVRRHGGALSLMIADIDHFKQINDGFGHACGDDVLQRFGDLLRAQVRPTDIVTRYGGDEFVTVMPHTALAEALKTAERIRDAMTSTQKTGPMSKPVSASLGVAELMPEESRESFLRRADHALYRAKHAGRNRVAAAAPPDSEDLSREASFR